MIVGFALSTPFRKYQLGYAISLYLLCTIPFDYAKTCSLARVRPNKFNLFCDILYA